MTGRGRGRTRITAPSDDPAPASSPWGAGRGRGKRSSDGASPPRQSKHTSPEAPLRHDEITVKTNMFPMRLPDDFLRSLRRFDVKIMAKISKGSKVLNVTLTGNPDNNDVQSSKFRERSWKVLDMYFALEFGRKTCFYYDGGTSLWLPEDQAEKVDVTSKDITVTDTLRREYGINDAELIEVSIQIQESSSDREPDSERHRQQLLEIITSQVLHDGDYLSFNNAFFTTASSERQPMGEGVYNVMGVRKNVRVVGRKDQPERRGFVLQADVTSATFFYPTTAERFCNAVLNRNNATERQLGDRDWKTLNRQFRGLTLKTTYANKREFTANGLSKRQLKDISFDHEGQHTYLVDYFRDKYGLQVKLLYLPAIVQRRPTGSSYFPIEFTLVVPNQRVGNDKQTKTQQRNIIKASALNPTRRFQAIETQCRTMQLRDNRFLRELHLTIEDNPIRTVAQVLPLPTVVYSSRSDRADDKLMQVNERGPGRGSWGFPNDRQRFYKAAKSDSWAVAVFGEETIFRNYPEKHRILNFIETLMDRARSLGMRLGKPCVKLFRHDESGVDECFRLFAKEQQQTKQTGYLICVVCSDDLHGAIKLNERMHQVQCQNLRAETLLKVTGPAGSQALTNVLMKTNMKLGGLNYSLRFAYSERFEKCMIVGIDVCHPTGSGRDSGEPSVVGICSTTKGNLFEYTGGYYYQEAKQEVLHHDVLQSALRRAVAAWRSNHNNELPLSFILIRDGVSEGQQQFVLESELAVFDELKAEVGAGWHLTCVLATKRHNSRMAQTPLVLSMANDTNVPPGTVAHVAVTHPNRRQFYLTSQQARQGTAKATLYEVIRDDGGRSDAEVQHLLMTLSCAHQICTHSIGLPQPVNGAHELAKRGRDVYRSYMDARFAANGSDGAGPPSLAELNANLGIEGTIFESHQFWA